MLAPRRVIPRDKPLLSSGRLRGLTSFAEVHVAVPGTRDGVSTDTRGGVASTGSFATSAGVDTELRLRPVLATGQAPELVFLVSLAGLCEPTVSVHREICHRSVLFARRTPVVVHFIEVLVAEAFTRHHGIPGPRLCADTAPRRRLVLRITSRACPRDSATRTPRRRWSGIVGPGHRRSATARVG